MPIYDLGKVIGPQGPKGDKGDSTESLSCTLITDWNDAIEPGFYYSAVDAANAPDFTETNSRGLYGIVFCYNKQVRQVAMPQFRADCKVRYCNSYDSQTWYPWEPLLPDATLIESGLMSATDKIKLSGIAANANNYTHPTTHPASMILLDDGQDLQGFAEEVTEVTNNITPEKIGAAPAYTYGTTDLTAGESPLETGKLYFVYE